MVTPLTFQKLAADLLRLFRTARGENEHTHTQTIICYFADVNIQLTATVPITKIYIKQ